MSSAVCPDGKEAAPAQPQFLSRLQGMSRTQLEQQQTFQAEYDLCCLVPYLCCKSLFTMVTESAESLALIPCALCVALDQLKEHKLRVDAGENMIWINDTQFQLSAISEVKLARDPYCCCIKRLKIKRPNHKTEKAVAVKDAELVCEFLRLKVEQNRELFPQQQGDQNIQLQDMRKQAKSAVWPEQGTLNAQARAIAAAPNDQQMTR